MHLLTLSLSDQQNTVEWCVKLCNWFGKKIKPQNLTWENNIFLSYENYSNYITIINIRLQFTSDGGPVRFLQKPLQRCRSAGNQICGLINIKCLWIPHVENSMTFFNALKQAIFRLYFCTLFTAGNPNREFYESEECLRRNVNSKSEHYLLWHSCLM